MRRPQDTFETPCTERGCDTGSDVDAAGSAHSDMSRQAVVHEGSHSCDLAAHGAAGHHAGQDRAVLVIVKPRRCRSDRAFRTALGLTMPARGAGGFALA